MLRTLLNGSANGLLEVARADLKLGRTAEARTEIQHLLDMGQADDALTTAPFDAFHDLTASIAANRAPVSRGSFAWEIPDTALLPEDLDYDAATHRFFVTSVLEKKIVVMDSAGKTTNFATAPDGWPMLALKIDTKHRRVWASEVALEGFTMVAKSDWGRSALVCYELDKGTLLLRIEGPEHSALGDMILSQDGTAIVSDGRAEVSTGRAMARDWSASMGESSFLHKLQPLTPRQDTYSYRTICAASVFWICPRGK